MEESVQLLEMSSGPLANTDRQVTDAVDLLNLRCLPFSLLMIRPVEETPVEPNTGNDTDKFPSNC